MRIEYRCSATGKNCQSNILFVSFFFCEPRQFETDEQCQGLRAVPSLLYSSTVTYWSFVGHSMNCILIRKKHTHITCDQTHGNPIIQIISVYTLFFRFPCDGSSKYISEHFILIEYNWVYIQFNSCHFNLSVKTICYLSSLIWVKHLLLPHWLVLIHFEKVYVATHNFVSPIFWFLYEWFIFKYTAPASKLFVWCFTIRYWFVRSHTYIRLVFSERRRLIYLSSFPLVFFWSFFLHLKIAILSFWYGIWIINDSLKAKVKNKQTNAKRFVYFGCCCRWPKRRQGKLLAFRIW